MTAWEELKDFWKVLRCKHDYQKMDGKLTLWECRKCGHLKVIIPKG
jgi:rubredoxin